MNESTYLRPVERRVVAMQSEGLDATEIATRLNRSPRHVEQMLRLIEIPRTEPPRKRVPSPMARRVLAMRAEGESFADIAARFKRSPRFIRQVAGLEHYRRGIDLLSEESHG